MSKKIRMKVNNDKNSVCEICNTLWKNTLEMYDLNIGDYYLTICHDCCDKIENKMIKASCVYNAKLKKQEDMERIRRYKNIKNKEMGIKYEKIGEILQEE